MEFVLLQEDEYAAFAQNHPYANFLNSIYSGRKFAHKGWSVDYVGMKDGQELLAATLLVSTPLHKDRYFYAPRGFLLDYSNAEVIKAFTKEVQRFAKEKGGLYLKIDPYVPYQEHDLNGAVVSDGFHHEEVVQNLCAAGFEHQGFSIGYDESTQCRWMSVLHVDGKSKEQLLKEMNSQTRQNIKNTIKNGIKVRALAFDELHILDEIVKATSERRGFTDFSLTYYEDEYKTFGEHACAYYAYLDLDDYDHLLQEEENKELEIIHVAETNLLENPHSKNSKSRLQSATQHMESLAKRKQDAQELRQRFAHEVPLAAAMFIKYGNEIVYLTSGSYDEFKRFKGPYAMQWYMIQMALAEGYANYNFYGISGYFEKDQEGFGVFDFKRGFKADVVELAGDFILPLKPQKYRIYKTLQNVKNSVRR